MSETARNRLKHLGHFKRADGSCYGPCPLCGWTTRATSLRDGRLAFIAHLRKKHLDALRTPTQSGEGG